MQVPVEHPAQCGLALGRGFLLLGLVGGVGAQEVVELVAVGCALFDEVGADQGVQELAGATGREAGEGGRGVQSEVGARVEAEETEEACDLFRQRPVGPGEDRTDGVGVLVLPDAEGVPER
ncbi:hypothetical protein [Streptomyces sp. CBMA156]|uniref:hypothetical protein n=1 Tax=Streptomyces sp. CBMA156 TaxID=1930280 RepID=UPI00398346D3